VTKLSPRPKWLLTRAGGAVPHPGFLLLGTPGNATGPVVILMLMHLAIAVITYTALTKIAPAPLAARDERHARARGALGLGRRATGR
jgi:hypothetical protein